MIIDTHIHVWELDSVSYPWRPLADIAPDYAWPVEKEIEVMARYGIDEANYRVACALMTPQGRTFAQSILHLFNRTEETSFPLSEEQIATEPEADQPTAEPPSPLISVADAEAQAGFHVAELSFVPDGFTYLGARMYGNAVNLEYQTSDLGGHLIITQSQGGYNESDWDSVPAEYIIPVKIGALDGEFVQGTFVVYPNDTEATWNGDASILRLRWEKDGVNYEIARYGDVQTIEYLDQAGLIALASDQCRCGPFWTWLFLRT